MADEVASKNKILSRLSAADAQLVTPHLQPVDLPVLRYLERRGRPIEFAYFVESGFASVVADGASERSVEVGLIGREGVTGLAVIMGSDRSPHDTFMQAAGAGQRIGVVNLLAAIGKSATFKKLFCNGATHS